MLGVWTCPTLPMPDGLTFLNISYTIFSNEKFTAVAA